MQATDSPENNGKADKRRRDGFIPARRIFAAIVSNSLKYFVILDAEKRDSELLNNHNFKTL